MIVKRVLVIGGLATALAVPAGIAVAAGSGPNPKSTTPSTTQPYGPRFGGGVGMMGGSRGMIGGGYGDPDDCPFYNSADRQKLQQERQKLQQQLQNAKTPAERQKLMQPWHDRVWANRTPSS